MALNGGQNGNGDKLWKRQREKYLLFFGMALTTASFIASVMTGVIYWQFGLAGLACCGVSLAQMSDIKNR